MTSTPIAFRVAIRPADPLGAVRLTRGRPEMRARHRAGSWPGGARLDGLIWCAEPRPVRAHAIFSATGKRIFELPISKTNLTA